MTTLSPQDIQAGGRRSSGKSVKTLKKMLKKAGLKTSGKKAALTRRAKKARLMHGGVETVARSPEMDRTAYALAMAVQGQGDLATARVNAENAGWTKEQITAIEAAWAPKKGGRKH
jgi:hypothetical protein